METQTPDHDLLRECIRQCWECRHACQETLFNHCLSMGGKHVEESHVKLMMDCIEICQVAADFMVRGSFLSKAVCIACAQVCEACATSCEQIGGHEMLRCAAACDDCAHICREHSGLFRAA